jgi:superfamily II RNA helicase
MFNYFIAFKQNFKIFAIKAFIIYHKNLKSVSLQGTFKEDNFAKAMQFLSDAHPAGDNVRPTNRRPIGGGDSNNKNVVKIIRTIMERDMLPCIIFSFSRKECELYATNVKQMDFNSGEPPEPELIKSQLICSFFHSFYFYF